jgi:hypothetical protein
MWITRVGTGRPDNHLTDEIRNVPPAVVRTQGFAVEIADIAATDAAAVHTLFAAGRSAARAAHNIRRNELAQPVRAAPRLTISGKQVRGEVPLHAVGKYRDYLSLAG